MGGGEERSFAEIFADARHAKGAESQLQPLWPNLPTVRCHAVAGVAGLQPFLAFSRRNTRLSANETDREFGGMLATRLTCSSALA